MTNETGNEQRDPMWDADWPELANWASTHAMPGSATAEKAQFIAHVRLAQDQAEAAREQAIWAKQAAEAANRTVRATWVLGGFTIALAVVALVVS